jgi:hypothetical protein
MQKYYKLLSQEMTSHNDTKWEIGVPIFVSKQGNEMCTDQVLHCYNHPMLAVIFNPIHANIRKPKLFEIQVDGICNNDGLKFASKSQTLIKEISLPEISLEQKIEFAIKVAKLVYKNGSWNSWADKWLDGSDRTVAAADAAHAAADAAADAAAYAHAYAAYAAADAAADAANAADAAAHAAADYAAAHAAAHAAHAAADAAAHAAAADADYAAAHAYAAYAHAASAVADAADAAAYAGKREEFNQKMINIVEEIVG